MQTKKIQESKVSVFFRLVYLVLVSIETTQFPHLSGKWISFRGKIFGLSNYVFADMRQLLLNMTYILCFTSMHV